MYLVYTRYTKIETNIDDSMLLLLLTKNKNNNYSTINKQKITIKQAKDREYNM